MDKFSHAVQSSVKQINRGIFPEEHERDISEENLKKDLLSIASRKDELKWKKLTDEMLNVDYVILFPRRLALLLMENLEQYLEYFSGNLAKVVIFGKPHDIPRLQVAHGDAGLFYKFSGVTIPAKPWFPTLEAIKSVVEEVSGYKYNFVLINKYRNGNDHIGEHRDNEKELDGNTPIASVSLGQQRTFVYKHRDARLKGKLKRNIASVKIELESGSLLLMNTPTNKYWYHSIPIRKGLIAPRINLTFRKLIT